MLDRWKPHKTLGLVSSAWSDAVQSVARKLGIANHFAIIVTGSDVRRAKPFPDGFLLAAERLNAAPELCVVVEDAEKGIIAANAAGMKCIAVPSRYTADNDFRQADLAIDSLHQITMAAIDAL